jgi:nucleoside-diphosphate-sugar epimerase
MPETVAGLAGETVVVTGAGGFIGSVLTTALLGQGARVRVLAGAPGQDTSRLPAGVQPVHADISDHAVLDQLSAGGAVCIHLAGLPSVAASLEAPLEYQRVHVGGTLAMLEACRRAGVRRFIYVSSAEVYGRSGMEQVGEDHPMAPRSPYAAGKAAAEQYVGAYARAFGMETVVLRPFSVYGPGMSRHSVLGTILRQTRQAGDVVLADLRPVRDYVFVSDVIEGILRAAVLPGSDQTFNLGTGVGTSVETLARTAMRVADRRLTLRCDPALRRPREAEIHHLVADPSCSERVLGWRAVVPLGEGLRRTLHWMETTP